MRITPACAADKPQWLAMRLALWPDEALPESEMDAMLADTVRFAVFVASHCSTLVGFAEASLRTDYVNGCETSPVTFLEGIYVDPGRRRQGVARALVDAVAGWSRNQGCTEFASDALLADEASHGMHAALGFEATERVLYFRKQV